MWHLRPRNAGRQVITLGRGRVNWLSKYLAQRSSLYYLPWINCPILSHAEFSCSPASPLNLHSLRVLTGAAANSISLVALICHFLRSLLKLAITWDCRYHISFILHLRNWRFAPLVTVARPSVSDGHRIQDRRENLLSSALPAWSDLSVHLRRCSLKFLAYLRVSAHNWWISVSFSEDRIKPNSRSDSS